jgi:hypothetical protein
MPSAAKKDNVDLQSSETLTYAGHLAVKVTLERSFNSPSGSHTEHEVQYYLGANDTLYAITLFGDSPALDVIATTFRID